MRIKKGYVVFHGNGGYPSERGKASKILEIGKHYRVIGGDENSCVTYIRLEGINGRWNTALFDGDFNSLPISRYYERYYS